MEMLLARDLDEALEARAAHPGCTVLAGGTDLMVQVNYDHLRPEIVLGIRRVEALRESTGSFIGAGVTYQRLESGPIKALAEAARTVGSPQIRSVGTIGGNLGTASPAGDSLPIIAALDAEVVLRSTSGERSLRWDEFITGVKRTALGSDELIVGVRFPDDIPDRQAFAKIGARNAMVISVASCCVFRWEDGTTRVALGSVGPLPVRTRKAEEMISAERSPSPEALAEFQRLVAEEVSPITDHRSTAAYRRHASGVLARRLLEEVLAR